MTFSNLKLMSVDQSPAGTPSAISFNRTIDSFVVSSWDGMLTFYNYHAAPYTTRTSLKAPHPLLCTQFAGQKLFAGDGDGTLHAADLSRMILQPLKVHELGISHVKAINDNVIVTGSWDKTIKILDTRAGQVISACLSLTGVRP